MDRAPAAGANRRARRGRRRRVELRPMSDENSLRGRVTKQGEEAIGKLAQELLENPIVSGALSAAFETRERAMRAQEVALGALNLPSASDLERLTRRLRSVSQRLEGIEDGLDRLEHAHRAGRSRPGPGGSAGRDRGDARAARGGRGCRSAPGRGQAQAQAQAGAKKAKPRRGIRVGELAPPGGAAQRRSRDLAQPQLGGGERVGVDPAALGRSTSETISTAAGREAPAAGEREQRRRLHLDRARPGAASRSSPARPS